MSALLEVEGLVAGYGRTQVLHEVALDVGEGEIVALIGANGAGKSTLLNTVMALIPVAAGDIRVAGRSVRSLSTAAVVREGLVQVPERRQLFGSMTVEENLRMGAFAVKDRGSIFGLMERQFEQFPILRERRRQRAGTLSGGQQQMLAIGRVLVGQPRLVILDEPSEGVQPNIVQKIGEIIVRLNTETALTTLLVEQNIDLVIACAQRCLIMDKGTIIAEIATGDLANPETARRYLSI